MKTIESKGLWKENMVTDINYGRMNLQVMGAVEMEPILILGEKLYNWISSQKKNPQHTCKEFLIENDLVTAIISKECVKPGTAFLVSLRIEEDHPVIYSVKIENINQYSFI